MAFGSHIINEIHIMTLKSRVAANTGATELA
jgi:hypothetical protein